MEPADILLTLPALLNGIQCSNDPRYAVQLDSSMPNVSTPKRPGRRLDTSSNKGERTSQDVEGPTVDGNLADS